MKRSVPRLQGAAKEAARSELVGRAVTVSRANDAALVGLAGDIIDETLHTLTLRLGGEPGGRRVQLAKSGCWFALGDGVVVEGRAIQFRSEDRTKKVR